MLYYLKNLQQRRWMISMPEDGYLSLSAEPAFIFRQFYTIFISMKMTMIKATVLIWNSLPKNMEISTFIRCLKKWIRRQPQPFIITTANV